MTKLHFTAPIEILGINPYVLVSAERAAQLKSDWRKPMPVTVQINGQPKPAWHINMMPVGNGSFYLYLHGEVRKASHTKVGDTVTVDVQFDAGYRNGPLHPMPEWFKGPLEADPIAKAAWDALIPSRQKEILRYLTSLKSNEARKRNVHKALHVLAGNEDRFMARPWKGGQ